MTPLYVSIAAFAVLLMFTMLLLCCVLDALHKIGNQPQPFVNASVPQPQWHIPPVPPTDWNLVQREERATQALERIARVVDDQGGLR